VELSLPAAYAPLDLWEWLHTLFSVSRWRADNGRNYAKIVCIWTV